MRFDNIEKKNRIDTGTSWNEVWWEQTLLNRANCDGQTCFMYFDNEEIAKRYDNNVRNRKDVYYGSEVFKMISEMENLKDCTVLDIGAGPGTNAIPISSLAKKVTAVEPAKAMADCLKTNIDNLGIDNLDIIEKTWEDIDIEQDLEGKYDIVMSTFAMGMDDIESALLKMNRVSKGIVLITWFTKVPIWERLNFEIWPAIHEKEFFPKPTMDVLINVLWENGILPDIKNCSMEKTVEFDNKEDILKAYLIDCDVDSKKVKDALDSYIEKNAEEKNGKYIIKNRSDYAIAVWDAVHENSEKK